MTKFSVDLKTKIIGDDTQIFFARAGEKGHLFDQVRASMAIGPDLPGLGLDLTKGYKKEDQLVAKINRARAIKSWCRESQKTRSGVPPTTNINSYSNEKKSSGHAQIEGAVTAYFEDMRHGDVLVIPNPFIFDNALLVELLPLGKQPVRIPGSEKFDGYTFDGRPFGHCREVPMTKLPQHIIELSRKPLALGRITLPGIRKRIFDLCYDDYALDDAFSARIATTKPEFRPFDATVLNAFVQMVSYNFERLEEGGGPDDLIGLREAAFLFGDEHDLEVKIDISSPGHMSIIDRTLKPLAAASVFSVLAAAGFDASAIDQSAIEVAVSNSYVDAMSDLCSAPVSQRTEAMLKFLPEAKFKEMCNHLRETVETTGARTTVEAKPSQE